MNNMFCYQCEQTMGGRGCSISGVCGKSPETAAAQDTLTTELVRLASTLKARGAPLDGQTAALFREGLFTCVTNVSFDTARILALAKKVSATNGWMSGGSSSTNFTLSDIWREPEDIRSLKSALLFGLRGMAAYAYHAAALGETDPSVDSFFVEGLSVLAEDRKPDYLCAELKRLGRINYRCMEMLDHANTSAFGDPTMTEVSRTIEPGPFIVVTGHDLKDLSELLEATDGTGVNVYTHGEMLPAHGYPKLRAHRQLRGNFGNAWQDQQQEFEYIPAPILWTTNCLMLPRESYADKVWTTNTVGFPCAHVIGERDGKKDFGPLIAAAKAAKGWKEPKTFTGVNGGGKLVTGCGWRSALKLVPKISELVRQGRIGGFMLVGGCDGAKAGRSVFTDIVKNAPKDRIVITLACGKYRFNDLDLGEIDGIPRLLDFGQCNDAYGAIQFASALANVFGCGINELPLEFVISWYEQKAVAVLLTLLALEIRNIRLGPTAPVFVSPNVFKTLADKLGLSLV